MTARFYTDSEKLKHYSGVSRCNCDKYKNTFNLKIYTGAEFYVYHFNKNEDLIIDTCYVVTGFLVTNRGIRITFLDKRSYKIFTVSELPNKFGGYDLVSHTPYACVIERTIKKSGTGKILQDVCLAATVRTKSHPKDRIPFHTQVVSPFLMKNFFTQEEIDLAMARLEMES